MCGIVAIFAYHPEAPAVDRNELITMRDHMTRRGPDAHGGWYDDEGRVALGHRRLSIIDLSERGSQPMLSADGSLAITYNGEIYNYRALRRELENKGYAFVSDSDTEVILQLYADRGEAMFEALRGMYAFALWDGRRQAMLVARDPYGIKPLYVHDDGRTVRIASQVKALHAGGAPSREPDAAGAVGMYVFGSVPEPHTLYRDISAIPAGTYRWWGANNTRGRHFSIPDVLRRAVETPAQCDDEMRAGQIAEALRDSVRHHMVADVPVGAFLSAGIDSTTLVSLMGEVQTLTLSFDEFRGTTADEVPLAEVAARHYGTRHTTRVITRDEFDADVPRVLDAMDQPSIDGFNTYFVSKATVELGLKVAVSGLGGDELFAGYPNTFDAIPRMNAFLCVPSRITGLAHLWRKIAPHFPVHPKMAGLLDYGGTHAGAYLLRRGLFLPWELPQIMAPDMARAGLAALQPLHHIAGAMRPDPGTPYARTAALEATLYMRNQLLRDSDWASMAHSLELRVPLVDATLLKTIAPLLASAGSVNKRWLSQAADPPLPRAIANKPKSGFNFPMEHWLGSSDELDTWRSVDALQSASWARRLAHSMVQRHYEKA